MKLGLVHTDVNPHPRCGIFIKHASPKAWLAEITRMQLKLSDCIIYPCPGLDANSISGILIIFKSTHKNLDIANNACVQKANTGFYIPDNTRLNMALTDEEFAKMFQGKPHFFHHELGLIELKEQLRWETILQAPEAHFPTIETPAKGVNIPSKVTAFSVEIEEKEEEKALENPFGDEPVDPKDVPFDMKKVLQGNNKEVEKYLKYLERNPDAALKMAVPLDMMGTSRGKAFAKYKFKSNFFESLGFGELSEKGSSTLKTLIGIIAIIAVFWIGYEVIQQVNKKQIEVVAGETTFSSEIDDETITETPATEEMVVESTDMDDVNSQNWNRSQNNYKPITVTPDSNIVENILLVFAIVVLVLLILYLAQYQKGKSQKAVKNKSSSPSWLDLPEESEIFSFTEEEEKESGFYFGGDELSTKGKLLAFGTIVGLLIYLFYPMLAMDGAGILFILIMGSIVVRLLYLLIRKNKSIIDE
ncbi:hypothetical protein U8527_15110 [Kordia algicida OT-1]|uniref:MoxR-vWA-beta-propeller ternary system domain-containing protein n=1 Tax=Kordia algicida OT-1 TaxID=391587 RepID=A9E792_9FLAO|nr:hypothetical protein [Kordia algicida]EDP94882.1 hypothetical protein KAOT1_08714 [Kordia algicida OT-1]